VIETSFPLLDGTPHNRSSSPAYTSDQWCFQVESDPTTNWWCFNYRDAGKTSASSSDGGLRIRLVYEEPLQPLERSKNFASLFLAIDSLKTGDYGATRSRFHKLQAPTFSEMTFPPPTYCPDLAGFLQVAFPTYLENWQLVDDPTCNEDDTGNNGCKYCPKGSHDPVHDCFIPKPGDPTPDPVLFWYTKQTSLTDADNNLYWRFNERTHTISGALRFLIWWPPGQNETWPTGWYGFLWIGFGGNGGAG